MAGLKDYLNKRKQSKLYNQWVKQAQLPADEIPDELSNVKSGSPDQPASTEDVSVPYSVQRGMIAIPVKYLVLMVLFIVAILVILAVLTTLLIVGS